jgi:hypothetical protein
VSGGDKTSSELLSQRPRACFTTTVGPSAGAATRATCEQRRDDTGRGSSETGAEPRALRLREPLASRPLSGRASACMVALASQGLRRHSVFLCVPECHVTPKLHFSATSLVPTTARPTC